MHTHFICLCLQGSVLVGQIERIWRELQCVNCPRKPFRRIGVECLSVDSSTIWPIVLCLPPHKLWGLEDVTWLQTSALLSLNWVLVIIVTQIFLWRCNWVRKCLCLCLVLRKLNQQELLLFLRIRAQTLGIISAYKKSNTSGVTLLF